MTTIKEKKTSQQLNEQTKLDKKKNEIVFMLTTETDNNNLSFLLI